MLWSSMSIWPTSTPSTPISAGEKLIDTFGRREARAKLLPEGELDAIASQPGDWRGVLVEGRLAENGVVTAAVKGNEEPAAGSDLNQAAGFDELAVKLLRLGLLEAFQLMGEPAVTAVGDHRQGHVEVDVQADLARQAVEMEEVDVGAQSVFDAVASGVVDNQLARTHVEVIGHEQSWFFTSQSRHRDLPNHALVIRQRHHFFHIVDLFLASLGNVNHGAGPVV